jgi:Protein of unknown function (DUF3987)
MMSWPAAAPPVVGRTMLPDNNSGEANVRSLISDAPEATRSNTWPELDMSLVSHGRLPAPTLEDDFLPAGWGEWIAAEATARACPRDYIMAGLISAASAWIGNARRVAPTSDWNEPAHLFLALIGTPSTGKTPALRPMIEASRKLERDAEPAWREALAKYELDAEVARAADEEWRQEVRAAKKGRVSPPERPAEAEVPLRPPRPRLVTMDTSTEKLQRLLADNEHGLLHVRDELAGWFGSFDRYGGDGADRGFYLECWNGGTYVADRVKFNDVPLRIESISLATIGGIVPEKVRKVLAGPDDGLPARFIFVWPEPTPIAPLCQRGATDTAECRFKLETAAKRLRTLEMGTDFTPRIILPLDADACWLFDEQRQEAMRRARAASGMAAGWHGKNPGRVLRLSLVFEQLTWAARDGVPEPAGVSADAVARAGGYIDYAAAMLERVIEWLAIGRGEADAAQIALHVQEIARRAPPRALLKPINERVLYQTRGFSWARDRRRRIEAFLILQESGWIRPLVAEITGRPRGDWQLNPRILEGRE